MCCNIKFIFDFFHSTSHTGRVIKMTFKDVRKYDDTAKESFEDMPLITGLLTNLGFYILMIAGFVSQLFVKQNVETEKNRDVSVESVLFGERLLQEILLKSIFFCRATFHFITNLNFSTSATFIEEFATASIVQLSVYRGLKSHSKIERPKTSDGLSSKLHKFQLITFSAQPLIIWMSLQIKWKRNEMFEFSLI